MDKSSIIIVNQTIDIDEKTLRPKKEPIEKIFIKHKWPGFGLKMSLGLENLPFDDFLKLMKELKFNEHNKDYLSIRYILHNFNECIDLMLDSDCSKVFAQCCYEIKTIKLPY